jgi:hypothetical protein
MAQTIEDLLGPEQTVEDLLGPPFLQEPVVPGDALERAAQDYASNLEFRKGTGSDVTAAQGAPAEFDRPLVKIVPELSEEEMGALREASPSDQKWAAGQNAIAKSVNSLTSFNNLALLGATMGLGASPALGRAVALGFAAYMGKNAVGAAHELAQEFGKPEAEQDPQKIGALMAEGGLNTFLAATGAAGGLRGEPATPAERVAGQLERQVRRTDLGEIESVAARGGRPTVEELLGPEEVQTSERLPKPEVPETPTETYQSGVEEIRAKGARTTRQIQELWPKARLSREQARAWRDRAWPKTEEPGTPSADEQTTQAVGENTPAAPRSGKETNAEQISKATQPHGDVLYTEGQGSGPGEMPAVEGGAGVSPRGPGETFPAPALLAPQADVQSVEPPPQTTALHPAQAPVMELPVDEVKLSKDVPNFKGGSGEETGVVTGQELQGKYERLGTAPIVVWRRVNGDLEVITGRHRLDLARRAKEKTIPAQVVDESKGFTREMALTFDAEANIRDGQGRVEDYAHYFRNSPQLTEEAARARGLLSRAKGAAGWDLGRNASDDLLALWQGGKVSEAQALAITRAAPGQADLQRVGTTAALRGERPDLLSNLIKAAQIESGGRADQLDLLGANDEAMRRMETMARRAAAAQRTFAEQIRAVLGAAKRPELAKKLGVDVGDPEGTLKRVAALRDEQARWQNWPLHPDLVEQARGGEFRLAEPESVEQQRARLAAEEQARLEAERREKVVATASEPLVGSRGDIGQGDLLGGGDLFSAPAPKPITHSMAAGVAPQLRTTPPRLPAPPKAVNLAPAAPMPTPKVGPLRARWTAMRTGLQAVVSPQNIDATAKAFSHILRENNAQAALDLVRADEHLGELRAYFDKTPVPKDWTYDPNQPLPHNYAVMDAFERNRLALPLRLQDFARAYDDEFAWRVAEVQKIKPNALQSLIQDYFPHMWEQPNDPNTKAVMQEIAAKAPFHGSGAFLKQRTVPFFAEGLARGLRPISDNPVDLLLAKMHQMDKFLMAAKTMQEAKANGMLKYYPLGRRIPAGRKVVDDPAFTVYAPPVLEVKEAFDAGVRRGLVDFMAKMGFRHERVAKLGVNEWGQYTTGHGEVKSRFGGPDFVIMHEIGHGLEERYGLSRYLLSNDTLKKEMRDLANLRLTGPASRKFRAYIQTPDEQVANAVHGYIYAPDEMARTAPHVQKVLRNIIRQHPELQDLNEIRPGFALGVGKTEMSLVGPQLAGHWTLPDGAAAVLKNFLSPGLSSWAPYRTLRAGSNILNAAQLGLSGFHVGFTSLDAVVSSAATALAYLARGEVVKAAKSAAFAPFAPVANYYVGKAVQAKMLNPRAARVPVLDFPRLGIGWNVKLSPSADALTKQIAELAVRGGLRAEIDPFWKTNITRNLVRAWNEGGVKNYAKAGLQVPLALVEQSMRPIAEYLVPRQKLGVFAQLALQELDRMGPGASAEQTRAAMARAADWTEDRMGQMTYDNLFYNKLVKDAALMGFRAYGWQLGKYRHTYGVATDTAAFAKGAAQKAIAAAQGKPQPAGKLDVTNRMMYPIALTAVTATVGAIVHRMLTGKNPQSTLDYLFPQNGQVDKDGRPQRLALPTYLKDLVSDWKDFPDYQKMGASFYHKLNPYIAATVDMWRNQDYYGVEIRHPDDPLSKQMADLSAFVLKQFTPFSVSGTMKLAEDQAPIAQFVLPFMGVVPAKKALLMSPAETLSADITRASMAGGGRTREQFDHSQALKTIVQDIRKNGTGGAKLTEALAAGQLRAGDEKALTSMLNTTPLQYQVGRMAPGDAMRVWRLAAPAEREQLKALLGRKLANTKVLDPAKRTAYLQELLRQ